MTTVTRIDPYALIVAVNRRATAELAKARADIEYLIAIYGPDEIARAARIGIEQRKRSAEGAE